MKKDKVVAFQKPEQAKDLLTELLRTGAQQLITTAVEVEFEELFSRYEDAVDGYGRSAVVRGFKHLAKVITGVRFRDGIEIRTTDTKKRIQEFSRVAA